MRIQTICIIIALFLFKGISIPSQIKLNKYSENEFEINIVLELPQFDNNILNNQFYKKLPHKKNVFIGIPYGITHRLSYKVKECEYSNHQLSLYRSSLMDLIGKEIPIIDLKGYLWIENTYCINLEISQLKNDYGTDILNQIKEVEINISFDQKINCKEYNSQSYLSSTADKIIINYKYAVKYSEKRALINFIDTTGGWIDHAKEYIKIKTATDEIYRISYTDLENCIPQISQLDPMTFNMYHNGEKYPIYIYGEEDHEFNQGDYIEFIGKRNKGHNYREINLYNEPYNEYLNRYSDTTIFWLTWKDSNRFRAKLSENNSINTADTLEFYFENYHVEQNNWFDYSADLLIRKELPFWIENKTWNWHSIAPGISTYIFSINDIYPNISSSIFAKIQSYASEKLKQSHLLALGINDNLTVYDSSYVDKYKQKVLRADINSSMLFNGDNKLKLLSFPTDQSVNLVFLDWYEIEYPKYLKLKDDSLRIDFKFLQSKKILALKIKKESNNNLVIWKSNEKIITPNIADDYLILTDTISSFDNLYIKVENRLRTPLIDKPKMFRNLRNENIKADYIIITHKTFYEYVKEYKNFIEATYSISVIEVDVEDIYDEFSYGHFNPESIKEFLISANNYWEVPVPKYVFIIGDGTYDYYRNKEKNMGSPESNNFVPSFGSPVSDSWYVCWDTTSAYFPMLNIGRIPVKSPDEFLRYFERHKQYLAYHPNDWNKRYMFFSGGLGNNQYEINQYKSINDKIIDLIEMSEVEGRSVHFYKTINPVTNFGPFSPEEIENAIDSSALIISYIGHSGTQTWDNNIVDPAQLNNNRGRYPLITDFGCSTGKFAEPDVNSFAEMFINDPKGQAIAYIGNSSLGFFSTSSLYPTLFYGKIFLESIYTISEAHKLAKMELLCTYGTSGVYSVFALTSTFFGDPIISLPIPDKADVCVYNSGIKSDLRILNDSEETLKSDIYFYNLGRVTADSINVIVKDEYNGYKEILTEMRIALPKFLSKISIGIPIKNKPGQHKIEVEFDVNKELDELYEDNNFANADFYVRNSKLRMLHKYMDEGTIYDSLVIINQVYSDKENKLTFQYSREKNFYNLKTIEKDLNSFITHINFNQPEDTGRIFIRAKTNIDSSYSLQASLMLSEKNSYFLNDSLTFGQIQKNNLSINNNFLIPDTLVTMFSVISAGYNDGKTAVISKNGQNYIPGGNTIGHHVCLFQDSTYEFVDYRRFNVYGGGENETKNYFKFLDSLTSDYLVLIAINDEGRVVDSLKRKLHEFGSIYIDSLRFRSSWAMIGKRGASRGSVPEKVSHPFQGKVSLDTLIKNTFAKGDFTTGYIGPAGRWENINIKSSSYDVFPIALRIIGEKLNGENDTLKRVLVTSPEIDIRDVDPLVYPFIKVKGEIKNNAIISLGVKYKQSAELLVKGACVNLSNDNSGKINFMINILNAGETQAKNFNTIVFISNMDNHIDTILNFRINDFPPRGESHVETSYFSTVPGLRLLNIVTDAYNEVIELYKDNNIYTSTFTVPKDTIAPFLKVTFDGNEIFDGDYVSSSPEIKIKLFDNLKIYARDTSYLKIWLDDEYVSYSKLFPIFNASDPLIELTLNEKFSGGEHILKILARDPSGNYVNVNGNIISFFVSSESKLLSVYNYPNPCRYETFFTFRLTKIPDKVVINIYTIAGRLIKQIIKYWPELKTDFNSIFWDCRDEDGDLLSNGVYFYKVTALDNGKTSSVIQKLAVIR